MSGASGSGASSALRWVIEHKACTGFDHCWAAAPAEVREQIVTVWGEDPWPLLIVPDTLAGEPS